MGVKDSGLNSTGRFLPPDSYFGEINSYQRGRPAVDFYSWVSEKSGTGRFAASSSVVA